MKTSADLKTDVMDELLFDPSVDETGIGVAVEDGVVTLSGHTKSYAEKLAAEDAVRRVEGVQAVANELKVELWPGFQHDDTDVAHAVAHALRWNSWLPANAVTASVSDGWVTLEGSVPWQYQKQEAKLAIQRLQGVKGVTSRIEVEPRVQATEVERKIQSAFQRAASLDARQVHVETSGSRAILRGKVRSFAESQDAERAAWSVPGVTSVRNETEIVVRDLSEV
jgi:osmotically-inducible protein OsmY